MVAVYDGAKEAVKQLSCYANFDMKKLSIVGRDYYTEEHMVGCYNAARYAVLGELGRIVGCFWGLLFESAFFAVWASDQS